MEVKIWILQDYIRYIFSKVLFFLLLAFGLILPWRMRARYSEFLLIYGDRINLYHPYYKHLNCAMQYFNQKRFHSALRDFKKAEKLNRQNNDINRFVALCYSNLGENEKYASEIIKVARKNKEFKGTWKPGKLSQPEIGRADSAVTQG